MINRKNYLGKKMFINSTSYSKGDIFAAGYSICAGVTEDGSSFKFTGNPNSNNPMHKDLLNLGCINTRKRSEVFIDAETIREFIHMKADQLGITLERNQGIVVKKIRDYLINVQQVEYVKDAYTGEEYWEDCVLKPGYAQCGRYPYQKSLTSRTNRDFWVYTTLEEAIEKVIALNEMYFIESEEELPMEKEVKPIFDFEEVNVGGYIHSRVIVLKNTKEAAQVYQLMKHAGIESVEDDLLKVYLIAETERYLLDKEGISKRLKHISNRELTTEEMREFIDTLSNEIYDGWYEADDKNISKLIEATMETIIEYSDTYILE